METKNLKSFIAVYEQGSMAKASQALYISPQGLSKSIARLEADLGETLFTRTNRGVAPTPYAVELYPKAREMVSLADSIEGGRPSDAKIELDLGQRVSPILRAHLCGGLRPGVSPCLFKDRGGQRCPGRRVGILGRGGLWLRVGSSRLCLLRRIAAEPPSPRCDCAGR